MLKSLSLIPAALIVAVTACDNQPAAPVDDLSAAGISMSAGQGSVIAEIRSATARYHDVAVAIAAGYVRATPCIYNTPGSKAIHFLKASLVNGSFNPSTPEVLLYEPMKNGNMRLVGVEFLIPSAAWDATNTGIPSLGSEPFMDRRSAPFGADFPNYALYVWAWRENPAGMYNQYNPNVSCEFADVSVIR